jgi:hypothetical protein
VFEPGPAFYVGCAIAALAIVWMVSANIRALNRYKGALDGRAPSLASRFAWLLSLLSAWTGPFVVLFAAVALVLGVREKRRVARGQITRRSALPAEMAVKNSLVLLAATALLLALLVADGALFSPSADPQ